MLSFFTIRLLRALLDKSHFLLHVKEVFIANTIILCIRIYTIIYGTVLNGVSVHFTSQPHFHKCYLRTKTVHLSASLGWRRGSSFSRFKTTLSELLGSQLLSLFWCCGSILLFLCPMSQAGSCCLVALLMHSVYLSLFCPAGPGHLHQRKLRWHM